MKLSEKGLAFVKSNEGLSLTAYKDSADRWTIGYGHLLQEYIPPITESVAAALLDVDLERAENIVNKLVKVSLLQNEFEALVDFAYNVGVGAFAGSTLLKRLNVGDFDGAIEEFSRWKYAKGKESKGLRDRRAREVALFNGTPERASRRTSSGTDGDVQGRDQLLGDG
jgi:GH24 family phage-related lysozyme (muramidase)